MKNGLFSEKMKLADIIFANYRLLYVLPCFEIGLGLGENTVKQACEKKRISTSLFLLVCNMYTFDNYSPDVNTLMQIPVNDLMLYLKNTHKDYIKNRMPQIIDQIMNLVDGCHVRHGEMLMGFCEKYRQEVNIHFNYEEQIVFPYINALLEGKKIDSYKIREYERSHGNLDAALNDLKNIIIKYLPVECTIEKCRNVLIDLFLFDTDLSKHTMLEDQILIALVERIENDIR